MAKTCVYLSGKVDDIRIRLGGERYDFGVPFEDYTVDFNQRGVDYCIIGISSGDFDLYILGDSFLRSYLSIYDFEESRVGLALHKYSKATIEPLNKPLNIYVLVLVISIAVLFLIFLICCICKSRVSKRKEQQQLTTDIQEEESTEQQSVLLKQTK